MRNFTERRGREMNITWKKMRIQVKFLKDGKPYLTTRCDMIEIMQWKGKTDDAGERNY